MSLSDAPTQIELNVEEAAAAWKKMQESDQKEFPWTIFTFPEDLFAKNLIVHTHTIGGFSEMSDTINALGGTKTCWGVYTVNVFSEGDTSRERKFVGFQKLPAKLSINAKRAATDVLPHVETLLDKADCFIETISIDELSDRHFLAPKLGTCPDFMQFHRVQFSLADPASTEIIPEPEEAIPKLLETDTYNFSYLVLTLSTDIKTRDIVIHQRTTPKGSLNEMIAVVKSISESNRPSYGIFKVQAVEDRVGKKDPSAKYVAFRHIPGGNLSLVSEIDPHVAPLLRTKKINISMYLEENRVEDLGNRMRIAKYLATQDDKERICFEFGPEESVRTSVEVNVDTVGKVEIASLKDIWDCVLSETHATTFAIFRLSTDKKEVEVVCSGTSPGLMSCQAALKALATSNRPVWGVFRVLGMNETNNKAGSRRKYIGFQMVPEVLSAPVMSTVSWMKILLASTLQQVNLWIQVDDIESTSEEVLTKKLIEIFASENASRFYFGGVISPEEESKIIETVLKSEETAAA